MARRETFKIINAESGSIGTSLDTDNLYTATEGCTLYRIVGNFSFCGATNSGTIHMRIGQDVEDHHPAQIDSHLENIDGSKAFYTLYDAAFYNDNNNVGINVPIDIKAKRILKEDDGINIYILGNVASGGFFSYSLTLFFLEK